MPARESTGGKLEVGKFQVILSPQARKYYDKVPPRTARALKNCFQQLEDNPFYLPGKIRRLKGHEGLFRYIVGPLRVVYRVDTQNRGVNIGAILPRGDIYKRI